MSSSGPAVRPLPAKPSIEFERKRAKKLLREMRAAHPHIPARLADAQLMIAREYGFRSWPRLVEYFTTLHRHERSQRQVQYGADFYEKQAQHLLERHRRRMFYAARLLAAFVPRFFGATLDEVFASPISIDEARLTIARELKFASWGELMANTVKPRDAWAETEAIRIRASTAISAGDLTALQQVVSEHPEVMNPRSDAEGGFVLDPMLYNAVYHERQTRSPEARRITDWVASQGGDLSATLNRMLLGHRGMPVAWVEFLLERGADPEWMPPNGITVLEHAIIRYANGEAVDVLVHRVTPRKAFWIAAGLGDVSSLDLYIDRDGNPTEAGRQNRPDFVAISLHAVPSLTIADDREIVWEAFYVAFLNSRFNAMDVLLDRGFPIDYAEWGESVLHRAISDANLPLVEYLVRRGADLDAGRQFSARAAAEEHYFRDILNDVRRRIVELCGGRNPDVIRDLVLHQRARPLDYASELESVIARARRQASGAGRPSVDPEDLLVALLLDGPPALPLGFLQHAGVDGWLLKQYVDARSNDVADKDIEPVLSADSEHALNAAVECARDKDRDVVSRLYLLAGLAAMEPNPLRDLIESFGGSIERLRELCQQI